MLHRNLSGLGKVTIRHQSLLKFTKFGQLIIRKIIKLYVIFTYVHMSHFKAKKHQIRFLVSVRLSLSVRLFVPLSVRVVDGV